MLLDATLEATHDAGLCRVELEVPSSNSGAISLYERSGFVHEGRKRTARALEAREPRIVTALGDLASVRTSTEAGTECR